MSRLRRALFALLVLSLLAAGCSGDDDDGGGSAAAADDDGQDGGAADPGSSDGAACEGESMKISISAGEGATVTYPVYVGVGAGLFEDEGVDVELVGLAGAGNILSAAVSGDTDGGVVTFPGVIEAAAAGAPIKAVASLQEGPGLAMPITQDFMDRLGLEEGDPVTADTISEAEGIRVGVTQVGGGGDTFGRLILEAGGLEEGDGYSVQVLGDAPSVIAAFSRGIVDAMVVTPSSAISTLDEFGGGYLFDPFSQDLADISPDLAPYDAQQGAVVAANPSSLDKPAYACFMTGLTKALELIESDPAAAADAALEFFPQYADREEAYAQMGEDLAEVTPSDPTIKPDLIDGAIAYLNATSDDEVELGFDDLVDTSLTGGS